MDTTALTLISTLVVLLALSAFFSASETAFSSLNRVRIKSLATSGNKRAARALKLAENYDTLLSSVLIGNNIVNILASGLATVLFVGWFGNVGVSLSTVVMTILVLIFGEISPKTLAKENPENFTMFAAPALSALLVIFRPFTKLSSVWTKFLAKLVRGGGGHTATEQELLTYVEEVRADGGINAQEESMIRSVIEFDDLHAIDIATPRVDIHAIPQDATPDYISLQFEESGYSRLPVYSDSLDNITGLLLEKDFHFAIEKYGKSLTDVMRPILFITKSVKISALLDQLRKSRIHMAVILDEYGGTLGIITLEDILEELVGDIWDEHDQIELDIIELAGGRYRVMGHTDIDDFADFFSLSADEFSSQSVGGWLAENLNKIPHENDTFTYGPLHITVEDVQRNRVVSVLIST